MSPGQDILDYMDYSQSAYENAKEGNYPQSAIDGLTSLGALGMMALPGSIKPVKSLIEDLFRRTDPTPPDGPIHAYHVSPHDFDEFDLSKRGTGEGHAIAGEGIYLAESPGVSGPDGYYDNMFLRKRIDDYEGRPPGYAWVNANPEPPGPKFDAAGRELPEHLSLFSSEQDAALALIRPMPERAFENPDYGTIRRTLSYNQDRVQRGLSDEEIADYLYDNADAAGTLGLPDIYGTSIRDRDYFLNQVRLLRHLKPNIYEVGIHANPADFLDGDLPLRDQPALYRLFMDSVVNPQTSRYRGRYYVEVPTQQPLTMETVNRNLNLISKQDPEARRAAHELMMRIGNDPFNAMNFGPTYLLKDSAGLTRGRAINNFYGGYRNLPGRMAMREAEQFMLPAADSGGRATTMMERMRDAGIPGLRFLDAFSRPTGRRQSALSTLLGRGQPTIVGTNTPPLRQRIRSILNPPKPPSNPTSNYTVNDARLLEILSKYGTIPLAYVGYNALQEEEQ